MESERYAAPPADGTPEPLPVVPPQPAPPVSRERAPARPASQRRRPGSRPQPQRDPQNQQIDEYAHTSAIGNRSGACA
jgi:hypothetical protein